MLVIVAIGVLIAIIDDLMRKKRLFRYLRRPCMGSDWRHSFPHASKDDIRVFLNIFTDAFMLKSKNRLKFSPNDKLIDVYNTMYPPGSICDAMELETFILELGCAYGIDFAEQGSLDHITLGQIFEMTRNSNNRLQSTSHYVRRA